MKVTKGKAKPKFDRFKMVEGTVEGFITDGFADITAVGEEFREICDNTPDSLQNSELYSTRDNTASEIEGLSEPTVDSSILGELTCSVRLDQGKVYRNRQSQSRACRANNGAAMLRAAAEAIREWLENSEEIEEPEKPENPGDDATEAQKKDYATEMEQYELDKEEYDAKVAEIGDLDDYNEARENADQLASECEDIADTVEGLEYPGMFG